MSAESIWTSWRNILPAQRSTIFLASVVQSFIRSLMSFVVFETEYIFRMRKMIFILMNTTHLVKHAKGRRKECWKRQLKQWRQNMHADLNISMCVILNCHG